MMQLTKILIVAGAALLHLGKMLSSPRSPILLILHHLPVTSSSLILFSGTAAPFTPSNSTIPSQNLTAKLVAQESPYTDRESKLLPRYEVGWPAFFPSWTYPKPSYPIPLELLLSRWTETCAVLNYTEVLHATELGRGAFLLFPNRPVLVCHEVLIEIAQVTDANPPDAVNDKREVEKSRPPPTYGHADLEDLLNSWARRCNMLNYTEILTASFDQYYRLYECRMVVEGIISKDTSDLKVSKHTRALDSELVSANGDELDATVAGHDKHKVTRSSARPLPPEARIDLSTLDNVYKKYCQGVNMTAVAASFVNTGIPIEPSLNQGSRHYICLWVIQQVQLLNPTPTGHEKREVERRAPFPPGAHINWKTLDDFWVTKCKDTNISAAAAALLDPHSPKPHSPNPPPSDQTSREYLCLWVLQQAHLLDATATGHEKREVERSPPIQPDHDLVDLLERWDYLCSNRNYTEVMLARPQWDGQSFIFTHDFACRRILLELLHESPDDVELEGKPANDNGIDSPGAGHQKREVAIVSSPRRDEKMLERYGKYCYYQFSFDEINSARNSLSAAPRLLLCYMLLSDILSELEVPLEKAKRIETIHLSVDADYKRREVVGDWPPDSFLIQVIEHWKQRCSGITKDEPVEISHDTITTMSFYAYYGSYTFSPIGTPARTPECRALLKLLYDAGKAKYGELGHSAYKRSLTGGQPHPTGAGLHKRDASNVTTLVEESGKRDSPPIEKRLSVIIRKILRDDKRLLCHITKFVRVWQDSDVAIPTELDARRRDLESAIRAWESALQQLVEEMADDEPVDDQKFAVLASSKSPDEKHLHKLIRKIRGDDDRLLFHVAKLVRVWRHADLAIPTELDARRRDLKAAIKAWERALKEIPDDMDELIDHDSLFLPSPAANQPDCC